MYSILMVAEKPMIADSISKFLCQDGQINKKFVKKSKVHEFNSFFPPTNCKVRVYFTSVFGHMTQLDFSKGDRNDGLGLFDIPVLVKSTDNGSLAQTLSSIAQKCHLLVLWLDCDKEGEHICFEVIDTVYNYMIPTNLPKNVYRARFSSISNKEIWKAMENLVEPNKFEAECVDVRRELDLRIGCSFSRYITSYFRDTFDGMQANLVTYGPCQTPTLRLCVDRYNKIQSFQSEKFYTLTLQVNINRPQILTMKWRRARLFDKKLCDAIKNYIQDEPLCTVLSINRSNQQVKPPIPLNTVSLISTVSRNFGISSFETMKLAEHLYLSGYISYPRTESTKYPSDFSYSSMVDNLRGYPNFANSCDYVIQSGIYNNTFGVNKGDHPPIIPVSMPNSNSLGRGEQIIFEFIGNHFLKTVCQPYVYEKISLTVQIKTEIFNYSCNSPLSMGWFELAGKNIKNSVRNEQFMLEGINLNKGDTVTNVGVFLEEKLTSTPSYLSESDLIDTMDKLRIGTDASMATHIKTVIERKYVSIDKNKKMIPSDFGIILIAVMDNIDIDLASAHMRSTMERELDFISKGQAPFLNVLQHFVKNYRDKYIYFSDSFSNYQDDFKKIVGITAIDNGRPFSRCGYCNRYMVLIEKSGLVLYCKECKKSYNLFKHGKLKIFNRQCPVDKFDLVVWTDLNNKHSTKLICPNCFINPTNDETKYNMDCAHCKVETCPFSLPNRQITMCQFCQNGRLTLSSDDKAINCNNCPYYIHFKKGVSIMSLTNICRVCNTSKMIKFKVSATSTEIICIHCNQSQLPHFMLINLPNANPTKRFESHQNFNRFRNGRGFSSRGSNRGRANFKRGNLANGQGASRGNGRGFNRGSRGRGRSRGRFSRY